MINFFDYTRTELATYLKENYELPSFRANQLFKWVYARGVTSFEEMTDIKKDTRKILSEEIIFDGLTLKTLKISKEDGARKYLFTLEDNQCIESVFIKQEFRNTICISSQVGCAMNCAFCSTAKLGFKRNLEVREIIGQVKYLLDDARERGETFTNIVFMGMGEPFMNFENVKKAIDILNDDYGFSFSQRKITVSTCGIVPKIKEFFDENIQASLAVSLNATTNEERNVLMPINKKYPIEELIKALEQAPLKNRKKVTIEYVLLKGINDSREDISRLKKLLSKVKAKVNLVPFNSGLNSKFKSPSDDIVLEIGNTLLKSNITTTIRWSKGKDIDAGCGQLALREGK